MVCSRDNMVYLWSVNSTWGESGAQFPYGIYLTCFQIRSITNHETIISYELPLYKWRLMNIEVLIGMEPDNIIL